MQKVSFIYCLIMMLYCHALGRQAPKWAVRYCDISKEKGVYCLNKEQAFLAARDKWRSLQDVIRAGYSSTKFSLIRL